MATETVEETTDQTVVYLGNRKAVVTTYDQPVVAGEDTPIDGVRTPAPGKRCTTVKIPASSTLMEAVHDIVGPRGIWAHCSDAPAPAWVASTDPALAGVLASHYKCELRDPEPETTEG